MSHWKALGNGEACGQTGQLMLFLKTVQFLAPALFSFFPVFLLPSSHTVLAKQDTRESLVVTQVSLSDPWISNVSSINTGLDHVNDKGYVFI